MRINKCQLLAVTLFLASLMSFACDKVEVEVSDNINYKEVIDGIINEIKPDLVLKVEDFTDINDCLRYRANLDGFVMIVLNRDCKVSSAILLPGNTTFIINNCTITQADYTFDNVFRSGNVVLDGNDAYYLPDKIDTLHNISIIGVGKAVIKGPDMNRIDPNNHNSPMVTADVYGARTHMVSLCLVDGGEIRGLTFTRPRGWSVCFEYSSNFTIRDCYFESTNMDSPYDFHATGDGIDLRRGCHHFNIYNISGSTTDDLIALNTGPVRDFESNRYYSAYSYKITRRLEKQDLKVSDIHDIHIDNIVKHGINERASGALIRLNCEGDKELYNIYISKGEYSGIVTKGNRQAIYFSHFSGPYTPDSIHDIFINDVKIVNTSRTIDNVLDATIKLKNVWASKLFNGSGGGVYNYLYNEGLVVTD